MRLRSSLIVKRLISALCAFLLTLSGASAEKHEGAGEADKPKVIEGGIPVQLKSFMVPIVTKDGWLTQAPMTLFMVVGDRESVEILCRNVPRVNEAVTITVDKNPITLSGNQFQLGDMGSRLLKAVNRALAGPLVIRLHVLPMQRRMGAGTQILDLPGNSTDCKGLKRLPGVVKALISGESEKAITFTIPGPEENPERWRKSTTQAVELAQTDPSGSGQNAPALPAGAIPMRQSDGMAAAEPDPDDCQNLTEVWPPGFHEVSGRRYWLDRAFTLDEDNNGTVDNIGFTLKAEDRSELYIYYFPGAGRQSVITVPTLRLSDDRDVVKICFGQEEFEKPEDKPKTKPEAFKTPDKAGFEDASAPGRAADPAPDNAFWDGPGLIFIIIAGAGLLLILGGGVGYAAAKRRSNRRREERRRLKERRGGDRRKRQEPPEGDDQRTEEDRREEAGRRKGEDRRKEEDRRR